MNKCMNSSDAFVSESLHGIVDAYPDFYHFTEDSRGIVYSGNAKRRVRIVTGGGYGHLPLFLGYVGNGMCDGVAVGNVFTSPSADTIMNVSRKMGSKEILFLFGNYFGDSMNFEMAQEMLEVDGITAEIVKGCDDLASSDVREARRGIAGIVFAYKAAGAAADIGLGLHEVTEIARMAIEHTSSMGVAFSSCTLPGEEKPIFEIANNEMAMGMGIHGEPGIRRTRMMNAKAIANELAEKCLSDQKVERDGKIAVLINGLGSTSQEELYILYHEMHSIFQSRGIEVMKTYIGEYVTSLEMAGISLSILNLNDRLEELLRSPAFSPFVTL